MPAPHQKNKLHKEDQKNLLIFAVAFAIVYLLFDMLILQPHMKKIDAYHKQEVQRKAEIKNEFREPLFYPREEIVEKDTRVPFTHDSLRGTIRLKGGRIDDITLNNYFETIKKEEHIAVMSPEKTKFPRYVEFGWLEGRNSGLALPNKESEWTVKSQSAERLTLQWNNQNGLIFERDIEISNNFLLKVTQRVINQGSSDLVLYPYTLITEHGLPNQLMNRWIIHEGPIGFIHDRLEERNYSDLIAKPLDQIEATRGWVGFTEQYWLTAILPEQEKQKTYRYAYQAPERPGFDKGRYQVDVLSDAQQISAGSTLEYSTHIFAGAKEYRTLQQYGEELNLPNFDSAIDFGWFWFLTKPFFTVLVLINSFVGYFAVSMLIFAFMLRLLIFPMANTSYRSFAKLRIITPRIMELKEMYSDDKAGLQKSLLELYKKEKVNPAAGCLPILIQIPIFFSLFKVLNVAIEMRHAPGFFWIDDLSAPDPTSLFNLFGLLPYDVPNILMIGAWPCIMVLTLLLQRSMNPPPTDPVIRDMFRFMPYLMGFVMSGFAAGLILYWTFSNMLSVIQQYTILRMMGVEVKFFQGWFGREYQSNAPDASRLGFSDEIIEAHKKAEEEKKGKKNPDQNNAEEVKEEAETIEISPPKPKKKKKKK